MLVVYAPFGAILIFGSDTTLGGVLIFGSIFVPVTAALVTVLVLRAGASDKTSTVPPHAGFNADGSHGAYGGGDYDGGSWGGDGGGGDGGW